MKWSHAVLTEILGFFVLLCESSSFPRYFKRLLWIFPATAVIFCLISQGLWEAGCCLNCSWTCSHARVLKNCLLDPGLFWFMYVKSAFIFSYVQHRIKHDHRPLEGVSCNTVSRTRFVNCVHTAFCAVLKCDCFRFAVIFHQKNAKTNLSWDITI